MRERQDLERRWQEFDARLNDAVARATHARRALRRELSGLGARFTAVDARLAREFPDYAALSNPKPLSIAAAQALLGPDEALFFTLDTAGGTFAWLVTKHRRPLAQACRSPPEDIADKVQALRCGLDYDGEWGVKDAARAQRCLRLLEAQRPHPHRQADPLPFDLAGGARTLRRTVRAVQGRDRRQAAARSCPPARSRACRSRSWSPRSPAAAFPADPQLSPACPGSARAHAHERAAVGDEPQGAARARQGERGAASRISGLEIRC